MKQIGRVIQRLDLHQSRQIGTPVRLASVLETGIHIAWIHSIAQTGSIVTNNLVHVVQEVIGGLRHRPQRDGVRLQPEERVAVGIPRCVHGDVIDGATFEVEDNEPEQCSGISAVEVVEELVDAVGRDEGLLREGETAGVEVRGNAARQVKDGLLGPLGHEAQPVGEDNDGGVGMAGELVLQTESVVFFLGAEEGTGDDHDVIEKGADASKFAGEVWLRDEALPFLEQVGARRSASESEGEGILDCGAWFGLSAEDELGDDAEAGAGAFDGK